MIEEKDLPALKERYKKIIQDEMALAGFLEDEDGDFTFRYECGNFAVEFDRTDPAFVRLVLPTLHAVSGATREEISRAEGCLNAVNYRCKAIKLFRSLKADKDGDFLIHASLEFFVNDIPSLSVRVFERQLSALKNCAAEFHAAIGASDSSSDRAARPAILASQLRH